MDNISNVIVANEQKLNLLAPIKNVRDSHKDFIKSPMNYIGGKYKLLNQIVPLLPNNINTFVDLFAGGCNVGINVDANKVIFNDNLTYLIDMYNQFKKQDILSIQEYIKNQISKFDLSRENEEGYKDFRVHYNNYKNPLDLFVLVAYSFNHQIRFNNNQKFNNPFGKNRSSYNATMEKNLVKFVSSVHSKDATFLSTCFNEFNFDSLSGNDVVYCDPPYLITTGTYNDGKRGFKGWSEKEELELLNILDSLDSNNIRFALSNVIEHKSKSNDILKKWLCQNKQYKAYCLEKNYSNSSYHTLDRSKNSSIEILVTNYAPPVAEKESQLFLSGKISK